MGFEISNPSSTVNSKLLVTKSNTAGSKLIGSTSVTGTGGITSYGQVTSSLSAESVVTKIFVTCGGDKPSAGNDTTVDLAIGGAGSEVIIGTEPLLPATPGASGSFFAVAELAVPLRIASGQRVAVRVTSPGALNTSIIAIDVFGAPYANLEGN